MKIHEGKIWVVLWLSHYDYPKVYGQKTTCQWNFIIEFTYHFQPPYCTLHKWMEQTSDTLYGERQKVHDTFPLDGVLTACCSGVSFVSSFFFSLHDIDETFA